MTTQVDLSYVARFPGTCDHEVSRQGESQPCERPAVAVRLHETHPYPVCAYHASGDMVPLTELLTAAKVQTIRDVIDAAREADLTLIPVEWLQELIDELEETPAMLQQAGGNPT